MKKMTKKNKYLLAVVFAALGVIILFVCLVVGIFRGIFSKKEFVKKPEIDYSAIQVARPEVQEAFLTKNVNSRPGTPLEKVRGVVVHYTANAGTNARANRNYFESRKEEPDEKGNKVSSHFIIGLDGEILCCVPENEIAYASNGRNGDTLSIECCHPNRTGQFTQATYRSLVHLVSYLCDKYELEQSGVIRHYDVTGKKCPKHMVDHPEAWIGFKKEVVAYLQKCKVRE